MIHKINIINRAMTPEETKRMDLGFEELSIEEGVALESSERISLVALEGSTFIGGASGLAFKNGDTFSGWFLLKELFVEKAYRSKGLGAKLLKATEAQAASIGVKHIWLWTSGEKALRFYHRHAYQKFTEMKNWYSDGSSRVGLRKDL